MELSERQQQIVKEILQTQAYMTMQQLASTLHVSYKTIANDIKQIDIWLQQHELCLEKTPHKGIRFLLDQEAINKLMQLLTCRESYHSIRERRLHMLLLYLWHPMTCFSIQKLSTTFYVSATSITHDIDQVQTKLSDYHIQLKKTKRGTYAIATEINIRKALLDIIENFLFEHGAQETSYVQLQSLLERVAGKSLPEIASVLNFLEELMKDMERDSMKIINEPYYTNAFHYITIMILRIYCGYCLTDASALVHANDAIDEVDMTLTRGLAKRMQQQYAITIEEVELVNIYRHLISGGLSKKDIAIVEKNTKEDNRMSLTLAYSRYLIEHMSTLFGIDFTNQVYLHSNLRFHIKPMINRLRYDISVSNTMVSEIKKRYPLQFVYTYISCMLTSKRYELPIPSPAEVAYIMVYFQSAMERNPHDVQALLVSGNSMGSAQLLKTRIENKFQDVKIQNIISPMKLDQVAMDNIDLILSTNEVKINLPYVRVSVFCDESDVAALRHYLKVYKQQKVNVEQEALHIQQSIQPVSMDAFCISIQEMRLYIIEDKQTCMYQLTKAQTDSYEIHYRTVAELATCLQHIFKIALPINC